MDEKFYTEILEKHIPEVRSMFRGNWRLQQDNDPKHTSRVAREFLDNNVPEVMDWPSNSPDLNPIENLWAIVKRNVELRQPTNLTELDRFLGEEWKNIPNSMLINLVNSMPQRCREIIEKNGERISYNIFFYYYSNFITYFFCTPLYFIYTLILNSKAKFIVILYVIIDNVSPQMVVYK